MPVTRIIISTIIIIVVTFSVIQDGSAYQFSLWQFRGTWYNVAIMSPRGQAPGNITCFQYHITRENGRQQNFKREYQLVTNGVRETYDGYGIIEQSIVKVLFPYHTNRSIYMVEKFNNGQELILRDLAQPSTYEMSSHADKVTVETAAEFEKLAREQNGEITYITQNDCE